MGPVGRQPEGLSEGELGEVELDGDGVPVGTADDEVPVATGEEDVPVATGDDEVPVATDVAEVCTLVDVPVDVPPGEAFVAEEISVEDAEVLIGPVDEDDAAEGGVDVAPPTRSCTP